MNGRTSPPGVEILLGLPGPKRGSTSMPANSKVARCVKEVKKKSKNVNPYAVCQESTGESYRTGKPPKTRAAKKKGK